MPRRSPYSGNGIRLVAVFEAAKGALVILTGLGLFSFIHKDLHAAAAELVERLHVNPARHTADIFIRAAGSVSDRELMILAAGAMLYSAVRFAEAWGLWQRRPWAEWFGLVSGAVYLPIEIVDVIQKQSWARVTVLAVNLAVVGYLLLLLHSGSKKLR